MAADIVNLNKARKRKARIERDAQAAENRVRFGRSKAERLRDAAERQRSAREIEGARRHSGKPADADDGSES